MFALKNRDTGEYMRNSNGRIIQHNSLNVIVTILELYKDKASYIVVPFLVQEDEE